MHSGAIVGYSNSPAHGPSFEFATKTGTPFVATLAPYQVLHVTACSVSTEPRALEADGDGCEGGEDEAFEGHDAGIAGGEAEVAGVGG